MRITRSFRRLRELVSIHGFWKALAVVVDWLVNRFLFVDAFVVVVLDREKVKRPRVVDMQPVTFRLARYEDLRALSRRPELDLGDDRLRAYLEGDSCLLQYVGDELAGYTWVHADGRPLLIPGLRLKTPDAYLYNYASLTLPRFRGRNHQALRHHELMQQARWRDRAGLLGYVRHTNWSSRAGLQKSGYRELGRIWMAGSGENLIAWIPPSLRKLGIARLETRLEPQITIERTVAQIIAGEVPAEAASGAEAPVNSADADPRVAVAALRQDVGELVAGQHPRADPGKTATPPAEGEASPPA